MNTDFRISTSIFQNIKFRKLSRIFGKQDAFWYLSNLWAYTALHHPEGDLSKLSIDDIEMACEYEGQEGELYHALVKIGFLDISENAISLHDWAEHNPYAASAVDRKINAKIGAVCRWAKSRLSTSLYSGFVAYIKEVATVDMSKKYEEILREYKAFAGSNAPDPKPIPKPKTKPQPANDKPLCDTIGAFGLSASEYSSLVDYLTSQKAFVLSRLEGLVAEFKKAETKLGLSIKDCIDCMKYHGWKGFRAEWAVSCEFFRERKRKLEQSQADKNAQRQIQKTQAYLRNLCQ